MKGHIYTTASSSEQISTTSWVHTANLHPNVTHLPLHSYTHMLYLCDSRGSWQGEQQQSESAGGGEKQI